MWPLSWQLASTAHVMPPKKPVPVVSRGRKLPTVPSRTLPALPSRVVLTSGPKYGRSMTECGMPADAPRSNNLDLCVQGVSCTPLSRQKASKPVHRALPPCPIPQIPPRGGRGKPGPQGKNHRILPLPNPGIAFPDVSRPRAAEGPGSVSKAMEKYENLGLVGEGSYGMVLKCKHKETGQYVAIKKFLESEEDKMVKKIALREVRMLKSLRHENLVNLIEVFRRKKRLYLVFEFVDHTVLDDLERCPNGLENSSVRKVLWQVLKGIEFCHLHNIIHRDIKPENILVSKSGIVKLCDFGFARTLAQPGEAYTDYVATRWYRAPELLVGDTKYGRAVDIWAVGCLTAEMLTGEPLFPGDSDIDQLFHIVRCFGSLTSRQKEIFHKNTLFVGMRLPEVREVEPLEKKFPRVDQLSMDVMKQCLRLEANDRPTCSHLLRHDYFTRDGFAQKFPQEIKTRIQKENQDNPLLRTKNGSSADRHKDNEDKKDSGGGRKKKKEKERRESKENDDDKPKRKLPDPEKFVKKSVSTGSGSQGLPSTSSGNKAGNQVAPVVEMPGVAESGGSATASPTGSMPPIQGSPANTSNNVPSSVPMAHPAVIVSFNDLSAPTTLPPSSSQGGPPPLRVNDKMKKTSTSMGPSSYYKKQPAPNHHSSAMSPQPTLQTEKTSLHNKTVQYDKMTTVKRRTKEELPRLEGASKVKTKEGLSFPEVRGAEANPGKSKNKKGFVGTMPHITNLDPFSDNQPQSPDRENLPNV